MLQDATEQGGQTLQERKMPLLIGGQPVYERETDSEEADGDGVGKDAAEGDGFRLVFDALEGRWVILRAFASLAPYPNGQAERQWESFEAQFPAYFRSVSHSAISSPADPSAVWEEWVFDPSLLLIRGEKGGYWKRTSSITVTRATSISRLCLPTSAYTPGPALSDVQGFRDQTAEELLASSQIGSVTVLDSTNLTSVAGMVTGMTTIDGYVPYGQTVLAISQPASSRATASSSSTSPPSPSPLSSADTVPAPTARLEHVTQDALRSLGALRYASSLVESGDKMHIYSVDFATDSITTVALLTSTWLAQRGEFVDRRRHGEERSRLVPEAQPSSACPAGAEAADTSGAGGAGGAGGREEAILQLTSPTSSSTPPPANITVGAACGMSEVVVGDTNLVVIGAGCHELSHLHVMGDREEKEKETTALTFDRPSLSPCVNLSTVAECASVRGRSVETLWEATVGWWVFASSSLFSSYSRPRNTAGGCQEQHGTLVAPSAFRNLRLPRPLSGSSAHPAEEGLLGAAVFEGPVCKDQDWDRPPGHELSAHNILMAHGEMQAVQFDGAINAGLRVAADAGALAATGAMPVHALTAESWITINTRSLPYAAILAAQRSGSASSPADSPAASGSGTRTNLRGWSLGYSVSSSHVLASSADSLASSIFVFFFVLRSLLSFLLLLLSSLASPPPPPPPLLSFFSPPQLIERGYEGARKEVRRVASRPSRNEDTDSHDPADSVEVSGIEVSPEDTAAGPEEANSNMIAEMTVSWECEAPLCVPGEWMHVVASYNGSDAGIFINGKLRASRSCSDLKLGPHAQCGPISFAKAEGEEEAEVQTPLLVGSLLNRRSGRSYSHVGAMRMARLYSRVLSPDEVAGQFMEGVKPTADLAGQPLAQAGLWNTPVSSSLYWLSTQPMGTDLDGQPSYNTAGPAVEFERVNLTQNARDSVIRVASPSVSRAGVQQQQRIEIQGRFLASRRHRCRFGFRHSRHDVSVVFTPAYVNQFERYHEAPSLRELAVQPDAQPIEYGSSVWCESPVWHLGYSVVHLGLEYERELAERDHYLAAHFDYLPGTRVEIDIGLLGRVLADMPHGISGHGTLPKGATRIGYVVWHNKTTGRTLIDVPDVVELNIFKSLLDVVLPDLLVYPIPFGDRAPEAVWVPVWQRACVWAECGFVEPWERLYADSLLYGSMHLFSGVPAKFALTTDSIVLAPFLTGISQSVQGSVFPGLEGTVAGVLGVQRASGAYLLMACESDGSSVAVSSSALHVHSLVYRVLNVSHAGSVSVVMKLVQRIASFGARQWVQGTLKASSGGDDVHIVVLSSSMQDLAVYSWLLPTAGSEDNSEILQEDYVLANSEGAAGVACLTIGAETLLAVAMYYDRTASSFSTTSTLQVLQHSNGRVTGSRLVQSFAVHAASKVEYASMDAADGSRRHFLAFLTGSATSRSSTHTPLYEWSGLTTAMAAQSGGAFMQPLQSLHTPGGAASLRLLQLSSGAYLFVAMHASCSTFKSGLGPEPGISADARAAQGECSALLRWNGTSFLGPFISQVTLFTDTAGGQEMPGASDLLLLRANASTSASKLMALSINFEMQVKPRFTFGEVGRFRDITRITRPRLFVERPEKLTCLAAPIALSLDETSGDVPAAQSRVLVLSYHMSAITIMDRCPRTGVLTLTPGVTQCVSALGQHAAPRSERGAVGMVLTVAKDGCYGNLNFTRCLYVLDIGARASPQLSALGDVTQDRVLGAVHVLGLSGQSGALAYLSSLASGAAVSGLPLSATVSRYVSGLGGGKAMVVSGDGSSLLLASWQVKGITLLDRDRDSGRITFGDTMTDGERMSWAWSSALPHPSPAALPFTEAREEANVSLAETGLLDFEAPDGRERSMLEEPSRVSGLGAPAAFWTQAMQQGNSSYLIVAAGPQGPITYRWNATSQRFNMGVAWTERVQNAVHVSVCTLPVLGPDGQNDTSVFAVVANWITPDEVQWQPATEDTAFADARIEVWQWSVRRAAFVFSHPLPSNPPAAEGGGATSGARAEVAKFSRSTASFVLSSAGSTRHCLAAAIQQDSGNIVSPSFIYLWEASAARFRVWQSVPVPGASFVTHTQLPVSGGEMADAGVLMLRGLFCHMNRSLLTLTHT